MDEDDVLMYRYHIWVYKKWGDSWVAFLVRISTFFPVILPLFIRDEIVRRKRVRQQGK